MVTLGVVAAPSLTSIVPSLTAMLYCPPPSPDSSNWKTALSPLDADATKRLSKVSKYSFTLATAMTFLLVDRRVAGGSTLFRSRALVPPNKDRAACACTVFHWGPAGARW